MDRLQAALPSILEGYCSKSDKPREEAEEEAKTFLKIIEDSSNYMFGYNHSTGYSMIGYMCGYLRYYYPAEFITAYLNNANNDEDINMGTELAKQLGIDIVSIKFRHADALYSCDAGNKKIYKGIASIKFMNNNVATELLALKDNNYDSFIDLLIDIQNTSCNSRQLEILIKLDFFSEFGTINQLLKQVELFTRIYGKKQFKVEKLEELEIPLHIIQQHAKKQTEKTMKDFDSLELLKAVCANYKYKPTSLIEKIRYELEHLGYITTVLPKIGEYYYFVIGIDKNWMTLYQLQTGSTLEIKFRKNVWNSNPVQAGEMIKVIDIHPEHKFVKNPDGTWGRSPELEDILGKWSVVRNE